MGRTFARKLFVAVTAIAATLMLVGGSYALTGTSAPGDDATVESTQTGEPEPTDLPETEGTEEGEAETEDEGVHGGSVARVHEGCEGVEGLEGNWTHGDYVKAVGEQSGKEAKKAAAHSDCGKPDKAAKDERKADKRAEKAEKSKGNGGGGDSGDDDDEEDEPEDEPEDE